MSMTATWRRWAGETSSVARDRRPARESQSGRNSTASASREVLPATGDVLEFRWAADWLQTVARRLTDLGQRPPGWDSYGALPLQEDVAEQAYLILDEYRGVIQTPPSISLTPGGGVLCEWQNSEASLELIVEADGDPRVFFVDAASQREQDVPMAECQSLDKWLWAASATA